MRALGGWAAATLLCYALFPKILGILIRPPVDRLVFTSPTEPFFAQCKLSILGGFLIAFPWLMYQAWVFVAPALQPRERGPLLKLIPASYLLFLAGGALGLFGVAPIGLKFLLSYSNQYLSAYITIGAYLSYLSYMTLGLAFLFQLPIVMYALAALGIVRPETLVPYRKHAFLLILVAAAAITPSPDVYGQVLIAIPGYILFEISLLAMRFALFGK